MKKIILGSITFISLIVLITLSVILYNKKSLLYEKELSNNLLQKELSNIELLQLELDTLELKYKNKTIITDSLLDDIKKIESVKKNFIEDDDITKNELEELNKTITLKHKKYKENIEKICFNNKECYFPLLNKFFELENHKNTVIEKFYKNHSKMLVIFNKEIKMKLIDEKINNIKLLIH